jgi:Ca-activated chloride channel family protein
MRRTTLLTAFAILLLVVGLIADLAASPRRHPGLMRKPVPTAHRQTAGTPLTLTAALAGARVLGQADGLTHLLVEVKAPESPNSVRPPLNVSLVIDRSGSMAGRKLRDAVEAARRFVEGLADRDRVSLVIYDSTVDTLVPWTTLSEGRARVLSALSEVHERGGTNLGGGLIEGIRQARAGSTERTVNRVILLSDGQANEGITAPSALARIAAAASQHRVNVTTVGVGDDYNEDLMMLIASRGGGGYHYIRDSRALARLFSAELKQLASTVGRNVRVEVELEPEVRLDEVYSVAHSRKRHGITARLGDIFAGQTRKAIFRLAVPVDSTGFVDVARVVLRYDNALADGKHMEAEVSVGMIVDPDPDAVAAAEDRDVGEKVALVRTVIEMDRAVRVYERGDTKGAQRALAKAKDRAATRAAAYGSAALAGEAQRVESLVDDMEESGHWDSQAGRHLRKASKASSWSAQQ